MTANDQMRFKDQGKNPFLVEAAETVDSLSSSFNKILAVCFSILESGEWLARNPPPPPPLNPPRTCEQATEELKTSYFSLTEPSNFQELVVFTCSNVILCQVDRR